MTIWLPEPEAETAFRNFLLVAHRSIPDGCFQFRTIRPGLLLAEEAFGITAFSTRHVENESRSFPSYGFRANAVSDAERFQRSVCAGLPPGSALWPEGCSVTGFIGKKRHSRLHKSRWRCINIKGVFSEYRAYCLRLPGPVCRTVSGNGGGFFLSGFCGVFRKEWRFPAAGPVAGGGVCMEKESRKAPPAGRSFTHYLRIYCSGFIMGAADVVPGVSGGTMAFILGNFNVLI